MRVVIEKHSLSTEIERYFQIKTGMIIYNDVVFNRIKNIRVVRDACYPFEYGVTVHLYVHHQMWAYI